MIDDQTPAGEWARAIARGCLEGRVSEYGPRVLPLADWLLTVPGVPSWWPNSESVEHHFFALPNNGATVSQHIGAGPNGDGVASKS